MHETILVTVRYTIRNGERDAFLQAVERAGIVAASRAEVGNRFYGYYLPTDDPNAVCLLEKWASADDQCAHGSTAHYAKLTELKRTYVEHVELHRYSGQELI